MHRSTDEAFKEEYSKSSGRYLVATRDLGRGDLISEHAPLIITLKDQDTIQGYCSCCCLPSNTTLLSCSGCKGIFYCSKHCQSRHWKAIHKLECSVLRRIFPKCLAGALLAVTRMSLLIKNNRGEDIKRMSNHREEHARTSRFPDLPLMISGLSEILQEPDKSFIEELFYTLAISRAQPVFKNSTDVVDSIEYKTEVSGTLGVVVDPTIALLNHSCQPNAHVTFSGTKAVIRAHRPIQLGEAITISYIYVRLPRPMRQQELSERYFFACLCRRCSRFPSLEDTFEAEYECYLCCNAPLEPGTTQCTKCKQNLDYESLRMAELYAAQAIASQDHTRMTEALDNLQKLGHWSHRGHLLYSLHHAVRSKLLDGAAYSSALDHSLYIVRLPIAESLMPDEILDLITCYKLILVMLDDPNQMSQSALLSTFSQLEVIELANYFGKNIAAQLPLSHGHSPFADSTLHTIEEFWQDLQLHPSGQKILQESRDTGQYEQTLRPMLEKIQRNIS